MKNTCRIINKMYFYIKKKNKTVSKTIYRLRILIFGKTLKKKKEMIKKFRAVVSSSDTGYKTVGTQVVSQVMEE